jgi:ATP-dependent Clp protease ATP-binding subunit ClpA
MIAQDLEVSLHMMFVEARQARHEFISVEHLLLALLDNPTASKALHACGAKLEELRQLLARHIADHTPRISAVREVDTQPSLGFQRVIQRAILNVQSSAAKEVTGADVLVAIFGEKDAYATRVLEQQGIQQLEVVKHVPRGAERPPPASANGARADAPSTETPPAGGHIAQDLEASLHTAFVAAREQRHEFVTVEHLLLALLDNPSAAELLRGCGANMGELRNQVTQRIAQDTPLVPVEREVETRPTLAFQRVVQRAVLHSRSSRNTEVVGADVLIALFGETDSNAVKILAQHGITRFEVVFYCTHGVAPGERSRESVPDGAELQVVLRNDDFTPMEFVVQVLEKFFGMSREDATETMLEVHRQGAAVCGLYDRDAAQELVKGVLEHSRQHGHPLNCGLAAPPR